MMTKIKVKPFELPITDLYTFLLITHTYILTLLIIYLTLITAIIMSFNEFGTGRAFSTTFGVLAAMSTTDPVRQAMLSVARGTFAMGLLIKIIVAYFFRPICEVPNFVYVIAVFVGAVVGFFMSYIYDRLAYYYIIDGKLELTDENGYTLFVNPEATRKVRSVIGLLPCFAGVSLALFFLVEMSKESQPALTEFFGAMYVLVLYLISTYLSEYLWVALECIFAIRLPQVPQN